MGIRGDDGKKGGGGNDGDDDDGQTTGRRDLLERRKRQRGWRDNGGVSGRKREDGAETSHRVGGKMETYRWMEG